MDKEIKLRECPFCGSKPIYGGYPDVSIQCKQCRQSIVKASWYKGDMGTMEASWNTRAESRKLKMFDELISNAGTFDGQLTNLFSQMNEGKNPNNRAALMASWINLKDVLAKAKKEIV